MIDSPVDASHPDLAGAITANFDAATGADRPHPHGTGMAGAIPARRTLVSAAPRVGLLTHAFGLRADSAQAYAAPLSPPPGPLKRADVPLQGK